jgi:signal transduction histidine kinase
MNQFIPKSLQWKLTLSYTFVTVGTLLVLELGLLGILGIITIAGRGIPSIPEWVAITTVVLGGAVLSGAVLFVGTIPLGLLFGFITARLLLTQRIKSLAEAATAYSYGDFTVIPKDKSEDELGQLAGRLRRMAVELATLLETRHELATVEARNRLARDLHDTVKQQIFALQMQVAAAQALIERDPGSAKSHITEANYLAQQAQQELKTLIDELRPAALDDKGLATAVRTYAQTWQQLTGIATEVGVSGERSLSLVREQALYRILQESLANVAKHSGANTVGIQLSYTPSTVTLTVQDNGLGFDPKTARSEGFGLQSMHQRAEELSGVLQIQSKTGRGTVVKVSLPV